MAEWLYERGIGEARAALVEGGAIVEAAVEPDDGGPRVGTTASARLIEPGPRQAIALLDDGNEVVLPPPRGVSVGREIMVTIIREAIPEPGRAKRARAVFAPPETVPALGPDLLARITTTGFPVGHLHPHQPDLLEAAGWSELLDEAIRGEIAFPGGALRLSLTPAMTLIDVDGDTAPETLALAGAAAAARTIRRFGIGGSIGIDLPTVTGKAIRHAVGAAIDAHLPPPFERTAMNGFGFVQIVRPRPRASLPELLRRDPAAAAARAALRQLERTPPGSTSRHRLPAPIVDAIAAQPDWLAELARRTGVSPILERA